MNFAEGGGSSANHLRPSLLGRALFAGPLILAHAVVHAQTQKTDLSISSTLTATNNGAVAAGDAQRSDLLFSVRPRVQYAREGAGVRVQAAADADFVTSANNTRRDRVLPTAGLALQGTVVERLLFIEANANVRQVEADAFGARASTDPSGNSRTVGTYQLSPYLNLEMSPRTSLLARADAARTRYAGTLEGDVDTRRALVRLDAKPEPLGATLEFQSENNEYADQSSSDLRIDRLTAAVNFALNAEWIVGAALGSERSEFASTKETSRVSGLRVFWAPGPRTQVAGAFDHRFFGNGWNVTARHRTPQTSIVLRSLREPSSAASSLAGQGSTGGLASFLGAVLTTRHPNDAERRSLVDDLIATRGLPTSIAGASATTGAYAQLRTGHELTWLWFSPRTSLLLSVYAQELRQLTRSDGTAVALGTPIGDSRQRGASFGWNRRLTPQTALDTSLSWSRIEGLALRAGDRTTEGSLRASIVRNLSPATNLSFGLLFRRVDTNVTTVIPSDENAAFVGLGHRF